jgi:amidase
VDAAELAAAIRLRQVSSVEVIETHLRRIEEVNRSVNAVVVVLGEVALEAARAADRAAGRDRDLPRLHGVPFTVKENIDVAGTATTQGATVLTGAYPAVDAPAVERLRAAGAIPIGGTNLPTTAKPSQAASPRSRIAGSAGSSSG